MMPVRTGVSDGLSTQVMAVQENEIEEGLEIISKVLTLPPLPKRPGHLGVAAAV